MSSSEMPHASGTDVEDAPSDGPALRRLQWSLREPARASAVGALRGPPEAGSGRSPVREQQGVTPVLTLGLDRLVCQGGPRCPTRPYHVATCARPGHDHPYPGPACPLRRSGRSSPSSARADGAGSLRRVSARSLAQEPALRRTLATSLRVSACTPAGGGRAEPGEGQQPRPRPGRAASGARRFCRHRNVRRGGDDREQVQTPPALHRNILESAQRAADVAA
jgi:hypothetical protein